MSRKIVRWLLAASAVICGIVAVWFGISFYNTMQEYQRGNQDLSQMYEAMGGVPAPITKEEMKTLDEPSLREVEEETHRLRLEGYRKLKEENSDMIGWVRIEGTVVDYPVMQTPENPDFYLNRGFDKKGSAYGMIYMDASCSLEKDSPNYVLYGHHMKNGSMFASIENYESKEFYEANPVIGFDTLDSINDYEVVAAFKLPASMINNEFAYMLAARTEEDYNALIQYVKDNDFYDTGITPKWPEQLITLTTCEYTQRDGRFLVIAKRMGLN